MEGILSERIKKDGAKRALLRRGRGGKISLFLFERKTASHREAEPEAVKLSVGAGGAANRMPSNR